MSTFQVQQEMNKYMANLQTEMSMYSSLIEQEKMKFPPNLTLIQFYINCHTQKIQEFKMGIPYLPSISYPVKPSSVFAEFDNITSPNLNINIGLRRQNQHYQNHRGSYNVYYNQKVNGRGISSNNNSNYPRGPFNRYNNQNNQTRGPRNNNNNGYNNNNHNDPNHTNNQNRNDYYQNNGCYNNRHNKNRNCNNNYHQNNYTRNVQNGRNGRNRHQHYLNNKNKPNQQSSSLRNRNKYYGLKLKMVLMDDDNGEINFEKFQFINFPLSYPVSQIRIKV